MKKETEMFFGFFTMIVLLFGGGLWMMDGVFESPGGPATNYPEIYCPELIQYCEKETLHTTIHGSLCEGENSNLAAFCGNLNISEWEAQINANAFRIKKRCMDACELVNQTIFKHEGYKDCWCQRNDTVMQVY